ALVLGGARDLPGGAPPARRARQRRCRLGGVHGRHGAHRLVALRPASPLAIPANLLALPAVAPILWLSLAAVVAHAVWAPLATPLLDLADLLAGYVLTIAAMCS